MRAYKVFKRRDGILTSSILYPCFSQEIIPNKCNKSQLGKFFVVSTAGDAHCWIAENKLTDIELWEVQIPSDIEIEWEPIDRHNFEEFWAGDNENALMIMKRPPCGTFLASSLKPVAVISL